MTSITRRLFVLASAPILALLLASSPCQAAESEAGKALKEAVQLASEGKYEEALQKHLWYHEHAEEIEPGQAGVRVSFALAYWADLGKKYPKALEALKSIRDQGTARLLAGEGDWKLFFEVDAINNALGEPRTTVELFKKIDAANPDLAAKVYGGASRTLVALGEHELVRKYMPDPSEQLRNARETLELSRTHGSAHGERMFTDQVVRLITTLEKIGEHQRALEIQAEALKAVDSPAIRDAVKQK